MSKIDDTLAERGTRYGAFPEHARICQAIKEAMWIEDGWGKLAPDQKQALETIADKIARMLNGDPDYVDNWHDIVGYAQLVEDRLTGTVRNLDLAPREDLRAALAEAGRDYANLTAALGVMYEPHQTLPERAVRRARELLVMRSACFDSAVTDTEARATPAMAARKA